MKRDIRMSAIARSAESGGPVSDSFRRVWYPFQAGKLHREVSYGGALRNAPANLQAGGFSGQSVQELIQAASARDGKPFEPLACELFYIRKHDSISLRQTVKDK